MLDEKQNLEEEAKKSAENEEEQIAFKAGVLEDAVNARENGE